MIIGVDKDKIGILTLDGASKVLNGAGFLANNAGASGFVTVSGTGTSWTNSDFLYIGNYGSGTLRVENGGKVTRYTCYMGMTPGAVGSVTITGSGSSWSNNSALYVGYLGSGTLRVENGGAVTTGTLLAALANLQGNGTITTKGFVGDADLVFDATHGRQQTLAFGTGGSLNLNLDGSGGLGVGYKGAGTLRIADGQAISSSYGYLGYNVGAYGTVSVTGSGSSWTNSTLYVGSLGSGTLRVENGGTVTTKTLYASLNDLQGNGTITTKGYVGDVDLVFDATHGRQQTLAFGTGGSLILNLDGSGSLGVGHKGSGRLRITGGQTVSSSTGVLANNADTVGTATISGNGSSWTNSSSLFVGRYGSGTLQVENGGKVSNSVGYISMYANAVGTVTVTGTESSWINNSTLYVGYSGSGTLQVENGGKVTSNTSYIGKNSDAVGTVTITGTGSSWLNSGALYVGSSSSGTLRVENGGAVATDTLYCSFADLRGNGTITTKGITSDVDLVFDAAHGHQQTFAFGTGGALNLNLDGSGDLGVGYKGSGTLQIAEGQAVSSIDGRVGVNTGATGTVTVNGSGSNWTITSHMCIGDFGNGKLRVENGGAINSNSTYIGTNAGSVGTAIVTGASSINGVSLRVGNSGSGKLWVENGASITSSIGDVGVNANGIGAVTIRDTGSKWTNSFALAIGFYGSGSLTLANGGKVTAQSLTINSQSAVNVHISGDDMMVLGNTTSIGSLANSGQVNLYVDAYLASGTYHPISEVNHRAMTWSGTGTYNSYGGTWDTTNKIVTVATATLLMVGTEHILSKGERLVITDPTSQQQVGISFGTATEGLAFSAHPMTDEEFSGLTLPTGVVVLNAWDFLLTATSCPALLSFELDPDASNLQAWQYRNNTWNPLDSDNLIYRNGIISFTVSTSGGYALLGTVVPEPASLGILGLGFIGMLSRRWRIRK